MKIGVNMSTEMKLVLRNFIIQLLIFSVILAIYFTLVLRHLGEPLTELFHQSLLVYAVASLLLIIVQVLFLDSLIGFIAKRLGVAS